MVTLGSDSPSTSSPPHNWRSLAVGAGLFCLIGGLFLAAGFKEVLWPKVLAIGGVVVMIVGGIANAVASRRQTSGQR